MHEYVLGSVRTYTSGLISSVQIIGSVNTAIQLSVNALLAQHLYCVFKNLRIAAFQFSAAIIVYLGEIGCQITCIVCTKISNRLSKNNFCSMTVSKYNVINF